MPHHWTQARSGTDHHMDKTPGHRFLSKRSRPKKKCTRFVFKKCPLHNKVPIRTQWAKHSIFPLFLVNCTRTDFSSEYPFSRRKSGVPICCLCSSRQVPFSILSYTFRCLSSSSVKNNTFVNFVTFVHLCSKFAISCKLDTLDLDHNSHVVSLSFHEILTETWLSFDVIVGQLAASHLDWCEITDFPHRCKFLNAKCSVESFDVFCHQNQIALQTHNTPSFRQMLPVWESDHRYSICFDFNNWIWPHVLCIRFCVPSNEAESTDTTIDQSKVLDCFWALSEKRQISQVPFNRVFIHQLKLFTWLLQCLKYAAECFK